MAKQFDATLKTLLEESPADWPALAGHRAEQVDLIDADISTVSGAADKVLLVRGRHDFIMHFEFQAGPDATLARRLSVYNSVLEDRHDLPVRSVVVLLRPEAQLNSIDGRYKRNLPDEEVPYREFRYQVIRVWELPVETLLGGGVGTLPLAPISAVASADLPDVMQALKERLSRPEHRAHADRLWTAIYVLMGLRFELSLIENLIRGVSGMEESVTYQAIVEKGVKVGRKQGAIDEVRKVLLRMGQQQYGVKPPRSVQAALDEMADLGALEKLTERLLETSSWDELLAGPKRPRRRGNKK